VKKKAKTRLQQALKMETSTCSERELRFEQESVSFLLQRNGLVSVEPYFGFESLMGLAGKRLLGDIQGPY